MPACGDDDGGERPLDGSPDGWVCTPATETCNGVDDDCNGRVDEEEPGTDLCLAEGDVTAAACLRGACTIETCAPGLSDCNGSFADGCETPTTGNPLHCGSCEEVCGRREVCLDRVCRQASVAQLGGGATERVHGLAVSGDINYVAGSVADGTSAIGASMLVGPGIFAAGLDFNADAPVFWTGYGATTGTASATGLAVTNESQVYVVGWYTTQLRIHSTTLASPDADRRHAFIAQFTWDGVLEQLERPSCSTSAIETRCSLEDVDSTGTSVVAVGEYEDTGGPGTHELAIEWGASGEIDRISLFEPSLPSSWTPDLVSIDPATGNIFVAGRSAAGTGVRLVRTSMAITGAHSGGAVATGIELRNSTEHFAAPAETFDLYVTSTRPSWLVDVENGSIADVAADQEGCVYVVGNTASSARAVTIRDRIVPGDGRGFIAVFDSMGALRWVAGIASAGAVEASKIAVNNPGTAIVIAGVIREAATIAGQTLMPAGTNEDVFVLRMDAARSFCH